MRKTEERPKEERQEVHSLIYTLKNPQISHISAQRARTQSIQSFSLIRPRRWCMSRSTAGSSAQCVCPYVQ